MHTLSIGDCIRFGWETFKQRPWILIGAFVLAMVIAGVHSSSRGSNRQSVGSSAGG